MEEVITGGIYRHYRGNLYLVENTVWDTVTGEERVVYRALYGERRLWTQPTTRFLEVMDAPDYNYHGPRMTYVEIEEKK